MDLTTADTHGSLWDFDSKVMRERAMRKVKEERPQLLIGSPMCTAFSTWQRINNLIRCPVTVAAEKKRAVEHLAFSVELYREQMRHGRYFVHEHPAYATSWQEEVIKNLLEEGAGRCTSHMRPMSLWLRIRSWRPRQETDDIHDELPRGCARTTTTVPRARGSMRPTQGGETRPVQRQNCTHGRRLPFQTLPRHPSWVQESTTEGRSLQRRFCRHA